MDEIRTVEKGKETPFNQIKIGKTSSEAVLEEYLFNNIKDFWKEIFDEQVDEAFRQFSIAQNRKLKKGQLFLRGTRMDIFVKCKSGRNYCVEIKNNKRDIFNAIGQILYYSVRFADVHKLVIISTDFSDYFSTLIKKYNLPIDFVLFTPDKAFLLKRE